MPKKIYPENIQKLKEQLETGNNLVDYFLYVGYPLQFVQMKKYIIYQMIII
jgi:hypothetical protein